MKVQNICFTGVPENYATIDNYVSRSAQPKEDDFVWLKDNGVTDIVNFRTMTVPELDFDEPELVKSLGMKYHSIPSVSKYPQEKNVFDFLALADEILSQNGKLHIHCKQGADRTGMYSYLYKSYKHIGSESENIAEWIAKGLHLEKYPNLISWAQNFVKNYLK